MSDQVGIQRIEIEGLHEQFDMDVCFQPGLNIIYGKNGRGKTTLLHIIANALEFDLQRFEHLSFKHICITAFNGKKLDLRRDSDGRITISSNALREPNLDSYADATGLSKAFGPRPIYLPAFRSVLERFRNDYSNPYRELGKEGETDLLTKKEFEMLHESHPSRLRDPSEVRSLRNEAEATARKTMQCRLWFGPFIPIIRYPSILDVDDGLSNEWRAAQLKLAQREQGMFADVFAKVFRTVVGLESGGASNESEETLLTSISKLLSETDTQTGILGPSPIYAQLQEATEYLKTHGEVRSNEIAHSVLQLYTKTLSDRNDARTKAFQSSRDFESSINKFLDKKKLRIGEITPTNRLRSAVNVGVDGGGFYGSSSLSSGEKQILTMLYSATRSRFRGGAVLIDEPELSLHVDWQRMILSELMTLSPESQIIACTHSPEVGADHISRTQDFEPIPSKDKNPPPDLFDDIEHLGE